MNETKKGGRWEEGKERKKKVFSPTVFVQPRSGQPLRFFFNYGIIYKVTGWESGIFFFWSVCASQRSDNIVASKIDRKAQRNMRRMHKFHLPSGENAARVAVKTDEMTSHLVRFITHEELIATIP